MKQTQSERVLAYIEEKGSISQLEALNELGVMRLASRISDLRRQGISIISNTEKVKNRWKETCHIKRYRLAAQPESCVCCGEIIPEGRQVCPACERSGQ